MDQVSFWYDPGPTFRYGLPYQGSKNAIAKWIVDNLPAGDVFADLFCGGGAVTHRALIAAKWKRYIMNDIDGRLPVLFKECVYGQHTIDKHKEWISREDFFRLKDADLYVALVWSFGNNGCNYIYGRDIEDFKHDYHTAVFSNDPSLLKKWGYDLTVKDTDDIYERYLHFNRQIKQVQRNDLDVLSRQIEIERLQRLQSYGLDYQEVPIPEHSVIYCDIPYRNTNCGKYGGFDHERFYEWAERQDNIFISEYSMPEDFIQIAETEKTILSASNGNSAKAMEKIFTNKRTYRRLR